MYHWSIPCLHPSWKVHTWIKCIVLNMYHNKMLYICIIVNLWFLVLLLVVIFLIITLPIFSVFLYAYMDPAYSITFFPLGFWSLVSHTTLLSFSAGFSTCGPWKNFWQLSARYYWNWVGYCLQVKPFKAVVPNFCVCGTLQGYFKWTRNPTRTAQ